MSTLLLQPPVLEPSRAATSDRAAPAAPTAPASPAPPLSHQLAQLFRSAGLAKADVGILAAVYGFVVLTMIFATFASRFRHASAFQWGAHLMNVPLGVVGLGLLAVATAAAAAALYFAGRSQRRATVVGLGAAILGCLGFIGTVVTDLDAKHYYGIRPAAAFKPNNRYVARQFGVKLPKGATAKPTATPVVVAAPVVSRTIDAANGKKLFFGTCASCHGFGGEGLPGQGKPLVANQFVAERDDAGMLGFLKIGRQPWDPLNTTKVQMPPRGGNPRLTDEDLRDIIAHLRTLQTATPAAAPGGVAAAGAAASGPAVATDATAPVEPVDISLLLPGWIMPSPPPGPAGLASEFQQAAARPKWKPPTDGMAFANSFYLSTELGAIHAALVAIVLSVLLILSARGRFTPQRRAPLALGLIASTVLTVSWSIVFPFIYLF